MCHSLCFGSRANRAQPQAWDAHRLTRKARGKLDITVQEKQGNAGQVFASGGEVGPPGGSGCAEI